MPGCAAVGCNNRSEKGYIMKCFPRDTKLRKIWQERVARADWEPSNNSFLCHIHFEPQQWTVTQSGRIRLRKNAVPSIFTVTSTRKSPKKKTKILNNIRKGEHNSEYMDNDTEHSSVEHLEEKHLDLDKSDTMIAEDNLADIGNLLVKQYNFEVQCTNDKKEIELPLTAGNLEGTRVTNVIVKEEIKLETMDHSTFEDSYDEIEEKLKQICDGGFTEDENRKSQARKTKIIKSRKESNGGDEVEVVEEREENNHNEKNIEMMERSNKVLPDDEHIVVQPVEIAHDCSTKEKVGCIAAEKEENVEIIFGHESGDDKMPPSQAASKPNSNDVLECEEVFCIKDERKTFNEDAEENSSKDEVHVIPNIRAAMKRKRRTRDEIMKSIKKSIRSTSDQDVYSLSNSELSGEGEEEGIQVGNELSSLSRDSNHINKNDLNHGTSKFIIKVTGDPDDVTEIIEEFSPSTMGTQVSINEENEAFVTSVITVVSPKSPQPDTTRDVSSPIDNDCYIISSNDTPMTNYSACEKRQLKNSNTAHNCNKCHCIEPSYSNEEEESRHRNVRSPLQNCIHSKQTSLRNSTECIQPTCEDLVDTVQIQEDVIAKLTEQLIIYKKLEKTFTSRNRALEKQLREVEPPKMSTRSTAMQSSILGKRNYDAKQRLIDDLSIRVNHFEEMNKKLMKTVTLESQQKRKLEGQIRQKDNRIKELNWKLEKASKYLERAEKNTNTYRRKMLNMQTIMRRRKLLDDTMSKFNEMLIDSSKGEFSVKVLTMAADVRRACGTIGYDKLLSYGFPLPPLPALRKEGINEDVAEASKNDANELQNSTNVKESVEEKETHKTNNDCDVNGKNAEMSSSIGKTAREGAETATGTVQDIFDENNDGDEFGTNELREHFILQLNAVM